MNQTFSTGLAWTLDFFYWFLFYISRFSTVGAAVLKSNKEQVKKTISQLSQFYDTFEKVFYFFSVWGFIFLCHRTDLFDLSFFLLLFQVLHPFFLFLFFLLKKKKD